MRILALDLAKNKSVYVDYVTGGGDRSFGKVSSSAAELEKLLLRCPPDRVVINDDAGRRTLPTQPPR